MLQWVQMQQILPPPLYIKSNLTFSILDGKIPKEFNFINQPVSPFGIAGLRWAHFDPIDHVGDEVKATVQVISSDPFTFSTDALLTAEATTDATYLGIKFYMNPSDQERLSAAIKKEGFYPTSYIRKYPRIPAIDTIYSMPVRAIVKTTETMIVFDIANISPNGILLQTENPTAVTLMPGSRITVQIEPRGDILQSFRFEGMICRIIMDKNPRTKNINRFLGIRLTKMEDAEKAIFQSVLKAVIANLQQEKMILP